tara:strand:- start:2772 stop:3578 length:807 start_codon:yes stop_codon:yes gene_type:complete
MGNTEINLFIATPCYGGQVFVNYFNSMLKLVLDLKQSGIKSTVKPIGNESLITRARNCLFSDFLESEEMYTHILFIDADIGFKSEDVVKLLEADKPIVGATYPHKNIFWGGIKKLVEKNGNGILNDMKYIESVTNNYSVELSYTKNEDGTLNVTADNKNSLLKTHYIPTGFMLIKREVGEKMKKCYSNEYYINDNKGYTNNKRVVWNFFNCFIEPSKQQYLSEDYAFCKRWEDCGGEIWLRYDIELTHCGTYMFKGRYIDKLNTSVIT